jgi:hypothetical protein
MICMLRSAGILIRSVGAQSDVEIDCDLQFMSTAEKCFEISDKELISRRVDGRK